MRTDTIIAFLLVLGLQASGQGGDGTVFDADFAHDPHGFVFTGDVVTGGPTDHVQKRNREK